jgi:UDP-glucose 4-epimerase
MRIAVTGPQGHLASVLEDMAPPGVTWLQYNYSILDYDKLMRWMELRHPDVMLHTAAIVSTLACEIAGPNAIDVNVKGTYNVVQACKEHGVKLVYFSSSAIYDPEATRPITEESPIKPFTIYPTTKYAGELLARGYMKGQSLMVWRPAMVYGGTSDVSMITHLLRSKLSGGHSTLFMDILQTKDYFWNTEFAAAAWGLIKLPSAWGETFNLSRSKPRPIADLVNIMQKQGVWPQHVYWRPEGDFLGDHWLSNDKLRLFLPKWETKVTWEEGIARTWKKLNPVTASSSSSKARTVVARRRSRAR